MKLKKLVLTGAAGRLGSYLREPLSKMCDELLSTDISDDIGTLYPGETFVKADIAKFDEVEPLLEGADMVVHFGAIVDERPFEEMLGPNFVGSYNVWEAGYRHGVRRVVYASSIHAVGMYPKTEFIDTEVAAPARHVLWSGQVLYRGPWPHVLGKASDGIRSSAHPERGTGDQSARAGVMAVL